MGLGIGVKLRARGMLHRWIGVLLILESTQLVIEQCCLICISAKPLILVLVSQVLLLKVLWRVAVVVPLLLLSKVMSILLLWLILLEGLCRKLNGVLPFEPLFLWVMMMLNVRPLHIHRCVVFGLQLLLARWSKLLIRMSM